MNIILFDAPEVRENLLPLSFTRPIADFRVGITTIRSKWERILPGDYSYITAGYLSEKYTATVDAGDENLFVAGHVIPDYSPAFAESVATLGVGEALFCNGELVAFRGSRASFDEGRHSSVKVWEGSLTAIHFVYDVFLNNGDQIVKDYAMLDVADGQPLSASNTLIGDAFDAAGRPMLYIAPGATVEGAIINVKGGPVYIGPDAEVMEGCCLRGPVALCEHAVFNMGTKVYPATTVGPWSKMGGELNNAVIFGYSNKAHDGFLGNAVIGEWCNLGADCVASNLKNDYSKVRVWNYAQHRFQRTDLQFCGLIMGDHSKAGINTMFNTATVVGVGCNIHGSGFPRTFIPSFSEGGAAGFSDVQLSKFFDIAERVMARRHKELTEADRHIFESIFEIADTYK
ncbi:MAG: glucose-1-phosphate thymidylyltransferase [Muribaculaceae bacterium]|nr:glucose-1-phosphate thymidylyltransferase [Muribaculaceae bacterium]MDE6346418.1 glucose-1-phosphate thymidylyltransferase [Muribaculaceae bacterium]